MKIISEQNIRRIKIEYNLEDRNMVFSKLDKEYGYLGYKTTICGPKVLDRNVGLMVLGKLEVDQKLTTGS